MWSQLSLFKPDRKQLELMTCLRRVIFFSHRDSSDLLKAAQTFVFPFFAQNEEVLKKCAQEYLTRVRKEEQRYQALKIHAEEKLDK